MPTQPTEITEATEQRAAREAWEDRATEEAEAADERGGTIPAEEVFAWFRSWIPPTRYCGRSRGRTKFGAK